MDDLIDYEPFVTDPLLSGTQPCGNCGVAGYIQWGVETGYLCLNCGAADNDD